MLRSWRTIFLAVIVLAGGEANGFYLPGVAPREYESGEKVELKVVLIF